MQIWVVQNSIAVLHKSSGQMSTEVSDLDQNYSAQISSH